jgi:ABC-type nitrate/sulfonate/bicarbonate transport system substrate-binding protein
MIDALEQGSVDLCLTVTDGLIAAKSKGRKVELVGSYVESSLIWAVAGSGKLKSLTDLETLERVRVGVSRMGSGSYTMAQYLALQLKRSPQTLDFVVANNFKGLREGIQADRFDFFMWETFTTKPYFLSGELYHVCIKLTSYLIVCYW